MGSHNDNQQKEVHAGVQGFGGSDNPPQEGGTVKQTLFNAALLKSEIDSTGLLPSANDC